MEEKAIYFLEPNIRQILVHKAIHFLPILKTCLALVLNVTKRSSKVLTKYYQVC